MAKFSALLQEAKTTDSYWVEVAKLDFALEFTRHMKAQGISKSEIARRLNTSPAYITKLLRGDANLTIESMVKAARSLGCDFHTHIANRNSSVRWYDVHVNATQISSPNPDAAKWVEFLKEPNREPITATA